MAIHFGSTSTISVVERITKKRISSGHQNCVAAIRAADLILNSCEGSFNPAATGRLVNPHESKRSFEDRDRRADGDASLLLPLGIDDHFVAALDSTALLNRQPVERRVLLVGNSLDQARAKT